MGSGLMTMNAHDTNTDDWLEQVLRADAREHASAYLPDDGFTARVVARLPQSAALPSWRRPVLIALWSMVAVAVIAALPMWFEDVFRGIVTLFIGQRIRVADFAMLLTLLGAITWGALFLAARTE
jgi:hypothetical protein